MDKKKFPCTGCGCCCRVINKLIDGAVKLQPQFPAIDLSFPYGWDESGTCEKFDKESNRCTIYEKRPLVCRVDEIGDALGLERSYNHKITSISCNKIMDKFGVDKSLNVFLK